MNRFRRMLIDALMPKGWVYGPPPAKPLERGTKRIELLNDPFAGSFAIALAAISRMDLSSGKHRLDQLRDKRRDYLLRDDLEVPSAVADQINGALERLRRQKP